MGRRVQKPRHVTLLRIAGAVLLGAWIAFCLTALALFMLTFTFA